MRKPQSPVSPVSVFAACVMPTECHSDLVRSCSDGGLYRRIICGASSPAASPAEGRLGQHLLRISYVPCSLHSI